MSGETIGETRLNCFLRFLGRTAAKIYVALPWVKKRMKADVEAKLRAEVMAIAEGIEQGKRCSVVVRLNEVDGLESQAQSLLESYVSLGAVMDRTVELEIVYPDGSTRKATPSQCAQELLEWEQLEFGLCVVA